MSTTAETSIASELLGTAKSVILVLFLYALYTAGYDYNWDRMLTHHLFIFAHLYIFGVKRFTLGNFNGFDLLFGCFYLYFWWQNPISFMVSYGVVAWAVFGVLKWKPIRDETSA